MTPDSSASRETILELARTVESYAARYGVEEHARILDLCAEAVGFAREEGDPATVGTRARSAAHLLLELVCPHLDRTSVHELSIACERAATRLG
jgi:hypothetical protein